MNKTSQRQLELQVFSNVNRKSPSVGSSKRSADSVQGSTVTNGFHKPASADDQSIYKSMSDNYFEAAKQA